MKVVILSRLPRAFSTKRLAREARARGHTALVADPEDFSLFVRRDGPVVYYKTRRLRQVDLVIPRLGASPTDFALSLVSAFQTLDVPCLNGCAAIVESRDKFRSLNVLARHGILVPPTLLARRPEDLARKVELLGGPPVIMKLAQKPGPGQGPGGPAGPGPQTPGVILAENMESIASILESFWELGRNILMQPFIAESKGRDVRMFVVGGAVVAALRRQARFGAFGAASVRRAAKVGSVAIEPPRAYREAAVRAAAALDLAVASVDVVGSREGPMVMEVGASPGFEEVERASRKNLAGAVVRFGERFVAARRAAAPGAVAPSTAAAATATLLTARPGKRRKERKRAAVSLR